MIYESRNLKAQPRVSEVGLSGWGEWRLHRRPKHMADGEEYDESYDKGKDEESASNPAKNFSSFFRPFRPVHVALNYGELGPAVGGYHVLLLWLALSDNLTKQKIVREPLQLSIIH